MTTYSRKPVQSRKTRYQFWNLALSIATLLFSASVGHAQIDDELSQEATAAATATILGQYASNVAVANIVTLFRTPVTVGAATTYWDITIEVTPTLNTSGVVTGFKTATSAVHSPTLLVGAFKAGIYQGPAGIDSGGMGLTLTGPGIGSGVTTWSIATAPGYDPCTIPGTAEFWVGPLTSSAIAARLKAAKITSTDWSFGEMGTYTCYPGAFNENNWPINGILGFSQVGNTITVASFSAYGTDYSQPVDELTYTLK
jgi:hypothetical protein